MKEKTNGLMNKYGVMFPVLGSFALVIVLTILFIPFRLAAKKDLNLTIDAGKQGYTVDDSSSATETGAGSIGESSEDGVVISQFANVDDSGNIVIPGTLKEKPVVGIANQAFMTGMFANTIESVVFPETLQTIGDEAFYGQKLKSVSFPDSVKSIGNKAFGSNEIEELSLNEGLEYIGELAFERNHITSVTIPSTVTFIGKSAFAQSNIQNLVFKEGTEPATIEKAAFRIESNGDNDVVVPGNYVSIGSGNFYNAHSLTWEESTTGQDQKYYADSSTKIDEFHGSSTITEIEGKMYRSTVIYGPKGSYLEQYANEIGNEFIPE